MLNKGKSRLEVEAVVQDGVMVEDEIVYINESEWEDPPKKAFLSKYGSKKVEVIRYKTDVTNLIFSRNKQK
jgi:hypothetical protein